MTSNPFFFFASFREISLPEISFSFNSGFEKVRPKGKKSRNFVKQIDKWQLL